MPLYEYRCIDDGTLITLLRPMSEADAPVEDPEGQGRPFHRVQSVFSVDAPIQSPDGPGPGCCGGGCGCHGH